MIVADLLRRIRAKAAPAIPSAVPGDVPNYPALVTCNYCLSERVVTRPPKRPQFCSHRCQRKAITRLIHGMRVRYEMAAKAERARLAAERKATARPSATNIRKVAA